MRTRGIRRVGVCSACSQYIAHRFICTNVQSVLIQTLPICGGVCGMEYCIGSTGLDHFSLVNWSNPV